MQLTKEQTQNILTLFKIGKFNLNSDEAKVFAILTQDLENSLKEEAKTE